MNVDQATFAVLTTTGQRTKTRYGIRPNRQKRRMPHRSPWISGLPKDKHHVFVYDADMCNFRPSKCNMDVATAEYFVFNKDGQDWTWIRDRNHVYYDETKLDVDRNTFAPLGTHLLVDGPGISFIWISGTKCSQQMRTDLESIPCNRPSTRRRLRQACA